MWHLKRIYNSEVIKQTKKKHETYSKCSVAISYIAYKWQPSLNKNHAHGNDVRPVERKRNYALSEKGAWVAREIIKDADNKEKNNAKNQRPAQDYHKIQTAGSQ